MPSEPRQRADQTRFLAGASVLLAIAGFLTISGCVDAPFVFDDMIVIVQNAMLTERFRWWDIFTTRHFSLYCPVTLLTLRLQAAVCGFDAAWTYRLVNWAIHFGSGVALMLLAIRIGLRRREALFVALVWTGHPMACESVAWVTERNNCLAFLFGSAGLLAYVTWHGSWRGIAGGAMGFLLALLSKPAALAWFPAFAAVELLGGADGLRGSPPPCGPKELPACEWKKGLARLVPFAILAAVFTAVVICLAESVICPPPGGHLHTALMTDTEVFARYMANILAPLRISLFYAVEDIVSFRDPRLLLYAPALAAAVGGSVWAARSRRRAVFGWLWFFGGLGPNANLVGSPYLMHDRYSYIASPGLWLVLVEAAQGTLDRLGGRGPEAGASEEPDGARTSAVLRRALPAVAALYVTMIAGLAIARSTDWRGGYTIFRHAVQSQPRSAIARINYGLALMQNVQVHRSPGPHFDPQAAKDEEAEAVEHLRVALDLPDFHRYFDPLRVRVDLAHAAVGMGNRTLAREALRGWLPPPDRHDPAEAGTPLASPPAGHGRMWASGRTYYYSLLHLAKGYVALAEAELADVQQPGTAPAAAASGAARALDLSRKAILAEGKYPLSYYAEAKASVASDILGSGTETAGQSDHALAEARNALSALGAYFDPARLPHALLDAPVPLPSPRRRAVVRLALARAQMPFAREELSPPRARTLAAKAVQLAERALQEDPSFTEACFVQAQAHLLWANLIGDGEDPDSRSGHVVRARALLARVDPLAPSYRQAQDLLRTLGPAPDPGSPAPR